MSGMRTANVQADAKAASSAVRMAICWCAKGPGREENAGAEEVQYAQQPLRGKEAIGEYAQKHRRQQGGDGHCAVDPGRLSR